MMDRFYRSAIWCTEHEEEIDKDVATHQMLVVLDKKHPGRVVYQSKTIPVGSKLLERTSKAVDRMVHMMNGQPEVVDDVFGEMA